MNKVLVFIVSLLILASCDGNDGSSKQPGTLLEQYVDSVTKACPNYKGNIMVCKQICADFESKVATLPGILDGTQFEFRNMAEIGGEITVDFHYVGDLLNGGASLSVWGEDFDHDQAATLDKSKSYKVVGGEIERYRYDKGIADDYLDLGTLYVRNLKVEEITQ